MSTPIIKAGTCNLSEDGGHGHESLTAVVGQQKDSNISIAHVIAPRPMRRVASSVVIELNGRVNAAVAPADCRRQELTSLRAT
jgi:hypothetical protein